MMAKQWTDLFLWKQFQRGDKNAFTNLVNQYSDVLYGYGQRFSADEELIRDCIQDVFLTLWHRREYLSETTCIKFYLMKALRQRIMRESTKWRTMDIHNEFHLQPLSPGKWLLYPYAIQRHEYLRKIRQPGEPVNSEFEFKNPFEAQVPIIIVNFIPDPNGGDAVIEELSIAVSNHDAVKIPVKMAPFQRLKLINEKQVQVFDRNWKLLETVNLSRPFPKVASGMNNLSIDAVFTGEGLPKLHLEIKTAGKGEDVTAHK